MGTYQGILLHLVVMTVRPYSLRAERDVAPLEPAEDGRGCRDGRVGVGEVGRDLGDERGGRGEWVREEVWVEGPDEGEGLHRGYAERAWVDSATCQAWMRGGCL